MKQFSLNFKNKIVKAQVKEDGDAVLYFDGGKILFLHSEAAADSYRIKAGDFSPAKEDLALLGKLLEHGIKEYTRLHQFQIELNGLKIKVQKNESGRYYIHLPKGKLSMIGLRAETGLWYQETFDEPQAAIPGLQKIGALIIEKENGLAAASPSPNNMHY